MKSRSLLRSSTCLFAALLALVPLARQISGQTAPQRSDELCSTLKQSGSDSGRQFTMTRPGACMLNIDTGYNLFVDYRDEVLAISLSFSPALLKGDASAFWLKLSTFDNLVQTALHTKQRTVFDEMNSLAKKLGQQIMATNTIPQDMLHSRTGKVALGVRMDPKTAIIILIASADVKDIEKMQRTREREASGEIATWRKVLAVSLQAFAAGAKGYSNAYANAQRNAQPAQTVFNARRTCYTNFIGGTAFTNCY